MQRIVTEAIVLSDLIGEVETPEAGAVVTFQGTARRHSGGREVDHLEYDVYLPMAERQIEKTISEMHNRWELCKVAFVHRVGRVELGETIVAVSVSAPHRKAAFAACEFAIDQLKSVVPLWKKEVYINGEEWVGEEGVVLEEAAS